MSIIVFTFCQKYVILKTMETSKINNNPDIPSPTPSVEIPAHPLPEHLQTTRNELEQLLRPLEATLPDSHSDPQSKVQAAYRTLLVASVDNFLPRSATPHARESLLTATYLHALDPTDEQSIQRTPAQLVERHQRLTGQDLFPSAVHKERAMGALSLGRNPFNTEQKHQMRRQFVTLASNDLETQVAELPEEERMMAVLQEAETLDMASTTPAPEVASSRFQKSKKPESGQSIAMRQRIFDDTITLLPYLSAMHDIMTNDPDIQREIEEDPLGGVLRAAEHVGLVNPDISAELPNSLRDEASTQLANEQLEVEQLGRKTIDAFSDIYRKYIPAATFKKVEGAEERILVLDPNEYDYLYSELNGHAPPSQAGVAIRQGNLIALRYPRQWDILEEESKQRVTEVYGSEEIAENTYNVIAFETAVIHEILHKFQDDSLPEPFMELAVCYYERQMNHELNTLGTLSNPDIEARVDFYQQLINVYGDDVHKTFFGSIQNAAQKAVILGSLTTEIIGRILPDYKEKFEKSAAPHMS